MMTDANKTTALLSQNNISLYFTLLIACPTTHEIKLSSRILHPTTQRNKNLLSTKPVE